MVTSFRISSDGYPELYEEIDGLAYTLACFRKSPKNEPDVAEVVFMVSQLNDKERFHQRIYPKMPTPTKYLDLDTINKVFAELKEELKTAKSAIW